MGVIVWLSEWTDVLQFGHFFILDIGSISSADNTKMNFTHIFMILYLFNQYIIAQPALKKTCKYKNNGVEYEINDGEVSEIKKTEVPLPWKYACNGCTQNGKIICKGTIVRDLYRWWFNAQCENGRMKPIARPWAEVVADPRFQELQSRQS